MGLETITQPIATQSIEEHERVLEEKMAEIRLEYVDRIFSKKIPPLEKKININTEDERELPLDDFDFLLSRYTSIVRDLMSYHIAQKKNAGVEWKPEMWDPIENEFKNKITEFRKEDGDHWVQRTMQLLKEEREKAGNKKKPAGQNTEFDTDDKHGIAGLINFDVDGGYKYWFKNSEIPVDIEDRDVCISVHLDALFKKTLDDPNINVFSSKSLEKLAVQIIEKFPETKAIIGQSWLMDTPIAKRIGFKIYKKENYSSHGGSFWQQFINSKGQIDNKRVKKFLETGEAPYGVALGAIMTEDFLKKYLPKERKGKVTLKELDLKLYEELEEERVMYSQFLKTWDALDKETMNTMLNRFKFVKKFNKSNEGQGCFEMFGDLKNKNVKEEEIIKDPRFKEYSNKFKEFTTRMKYKDKEVIIE